MSNVAPSSSPPPSPTASSRAVLRAALARQHSERTAHEQCNAELANRVAGMRSGNAVLTAQHARLDALIAKLARGSR